MTTVMELVQEVKDCMTEPPQGCDKDEMRKAFLLGLGIDYNVLETAAVAALGIITDHALADSYYESGDVEALVKLTHIIPNVRELYLRKKNGKWYYWDTHARVTIAHGDTARAKPFSVLCTDCGGMLKMLTLNEVTANKLDWNTKEPCIECNDDPTQTISAQFNAETEGLERKEG